MLIRTASPADFNAIASLTVAAYAALPGMGPMGRYGEDLADVAGRASHGTVLVAVEGEEILGSLTYYDRYGEEMVPQAETLADLAGFRMLATALAGQGHGVGEALTVACIDRARAAGAPGISLHTTDLMQAAQRLYRRLGFERWTDIDLTIGRTKPMTVLGFRLLFT